MKFGHAVGFPSANPYQLFLTTNGEFVPRGPIDPIPHPSTTAATGYMFCQLP
jgi:hypothetical protein